MELRKRTTVPATISMVFARPPFLSMDADRSGLLNRDLPGGAVALAEAVELVAGVLLRRERGLGAAQVRVEVSQLSEAHAEWSAEMCMSVLRTDPRFRFSPSGAVGLSQWDSVRVPTRAGIVQQCLEESGGRVRVEVVLRRVEAHYGAAPDRATVGLLANQLGAALRGEWVELEREK